MARTLLILFSNIGIVMPLLMLGLLEPNRGEPGLPAWVQMGGYVLGMSLVLAQLAELMRPGILSRRLITCVLGADGIQGLERFVPWSKVTLVVPVGDRDFQPPPRPYGAKLESGVAIGVEGEEPLVVWVAEPAQLIAEAEELRAADEARRLAPASAAKSAGYREQTVTPEMLVRVVLDSSAVSSRRIEAFSRLETEEREQLLETIADVDFRRELIA